MDELRFAAALEKAAGREKAGIGTLGEKGVHHALKHYYEPDAECHEVKLGNYVADIVGESGVIEIQTGSFLPLVPKLRSFLELTCVTVVWPCIVKRRIIRIDPETGEQLDTRISPRKQSVYELFPRLEQLGELALNERLTVVAALLEASEYRTPLKNCTRKERIKAKIDIIPTKFTGELRFETPSDYLAYVPESLPEHFTLSVLAEHAGLRRELARSLLWYMKKAGAALECGKVGREKRYELSADFSAGKHSPDV